MISATYSPEDNKIRLRSSSRLDPETYSRVRAAGFIWAPKQGLFVAPTWTPEREDVAVELAGELEDEDTTLVERAEDRAERFEDYSENRAADAVGALEAVQRLKGGAIIGHQQEKSDASKEHAGIVLAKSQQERSGHARNDDPVLGVDGGDRRARVRESQVSPEGMGRTPSGVGPRERHTAGGSSAPSLRQPDLLQPGAPLRGVAGGQHAGLLAEGPTPSELDWVPAERRPASCAGAPGGDGEGREERGRCPDGDSGYGNQAAGRGRGIEGLACEGVRRGKGDRDLHRAAEDLGACPLVVAHHSERRARKDAERIENGMRKAIRLWETSDYWTRRAAGALAHAKYKERPDVRARRIKGLEAELRKQVRRIDDANGFIQAWSKPELTLQGALAIANYDHVSIRDGGDWSSLWSALDRGTITPEDAATRAKAAHERSIVVAIRWKMHLENRLAYERAMLGETGGLAAARFNLELGGRVLYRGVWSVILRINRKDGVAVSLRVNHRWTSVIGVEDVEDYREPEEGDTEKVKVATKLLPLVNYPGEGFKHMTSDEWKRRPTDFKRTAKCRATETHGAYRQRETMRGGGDFRMVSVYLTDAKLVERPEARPTPAPPVPSPEPELAARAPVERKAPRAPSPAQQLREQLRAGVQVVSAPELFPTPPDLARRVVELADVAGMDVLEPSAGTGVLAVEALRQGAAMVRTFELNEKLCDVISRAKYERGSLCPSPPTDFLAVVTEQRFDRVVMNPPFSAEVEHVTRAFELLVPGGKLVAVMSAGAKFRSERKYVAFRELVARGGTIEDLPEGSFSASGTNVNTVLVQMSKQEAS